MEQKKYTMYYVNNSENISLASAAHLACHFFKEPICTVITQTHIGERRTFNRIYGYVRRHTYLTISTRDGNEENRYKKRNA